MFFAWVRSGSIISRADPARSAQCQLGFANLLDEGLKPLDASAEPDWAVLVEGLTRLLPAVTDPVALGEALAHWILDHRDRTRKPGTWEGYEAVATLARSLVRMRRG